MCVLELAVHPCVATDVMPLCSCTQPRSLNFLALCFPEAIIFLMCIKIFTHGYHLALLWKEEEKVGIPVAVALFCFYTWGLFGRSSLGEPSLNTGLWEVEWGLPAVLWCCCFICYLVLLGSRINLWISQLQMFETLNVCPWKMPAGFGVPYSIPLTSLPG